MSGEYQKVDIGNGTFYIGDCFDVMRDLPDGSVDMVLCDLPYGTTDCKWDSVVSLESLWAEYLRVCTPSAAIILTAAQPFNIVLGHSCLRFFRYEWIWQKTKATGFFNAKKQPLRLHENVLVFYQSPPVYNPQMTIAPPEKVDKRKTINTSVIKNGVYSRAGRSCNTNQRKPDEGLRYPTSVLTFQGEPKKIHETQKPVALFEYLIRTYTNEDMVVLDNTAGSGTTAIAAENAGRRWICIERDPEYASKAIERIRAHVGQPQDEFEALFG